MSLNWKDVSSFSRGDTDRSPRTVVAMLGSVRLVVTRHQHYPGKWLTRAEPFVTDHVLEADELEAAKTEAIAVLRRNGREFAEMFNALKP